GFDDVSTFIASGNVIFRTSGRASEMEAAAEAALRDALGFEVVTFVRTAPAISRVVGASPFADADDSTHVGFLKKAPGAAVRSALDALGNDSDSVTATGKEVYWLARSGMGRATISGATIEKKLGQPTTFRSLKMLKRLDAKLRA
ncbi:MAG TPA: DUF1697 domain-containing protein, partial [Actinomycetota bacterium]|nr:DUF1697 domain-containing protein [Actinomycetota bacterium]